MGAILSDISQLEDRFDKAMTALTTKIEENAAPPVSDQSERVRELEDDVSKLTEKLEKEERVHAALQEEFLDVCQDFGSMELETMAAAANADTSDELEALKRAREADIEEVDEIIAKIAPLVEG